MVADRAALPVAAHQEAIVQALKLNQVLVVAGDTGERLAGEGGGGRGECEVHVMPSNLYTRKPENPKTLVSQIPILPSNGEQGPSLDPQTRAPPPHPCRLYRNPKPITPKP